MRQTHRGARAWGVASLLMLPAFGLLGLIVYRCSGHFVYSLDDPYIHLELARHLASGHYGINASEFSAPSSSILWPFLLAPFAALPGYAFVPALLNLICLFATLFVLARYVANFDFARCVLLTGLIALSLNFYGLVFTGMEHSLHVFLALSAAVVVLRIQRRGATPSMANLLCGVLLALSLTRYEGLAISVPLLGYLAWQGQARRALVTLAAIVTLLAGFSFFLEELDLGFVPSSILAKSQPGAGTIVRNIGDNITRYGVLIALAPLLIYTVFRRDRALAITLASALLLHCLFGRTGWFGRYEVYILAFFVPFIVDTTLRTRPRLALLTVLMPLAFSSLATSTLQTPSAASNIYNQQYRMAHIADALHAPIAVNDLGLVAFTTDTYVLDLYGLGSLAALQARRSDRNDSQWIARLMRAHDIPYAFVYEGWFPDGPSGFIKVGELWLTERRITPASSRVSLFARDAAHARRLIHELRLYTDTHPSSNFGIRLTASSLAKADTHLSTSTDPERP